MNIIVPMAGWGKRLRPHTLTVPKPMVNVAGKPIVEHLVNTLANSVSEPIENIYFIIRKEFGASVETKLKEIATTMKAKANIVYQESPEGTAHAIYCAKDGLQGPVIIAFADTLFTANFTIDETCDGIVWTKQVEDPSAFGVVQVNDENVITAFIEKPENPVSNLAIIGIYYFKEGEALLKEIKYLLDNNLREKGEFQITNALEQLKSKGARLVPGVVDEWLDCGNKDACIHTNQRMLALYKGEQTIKQTETSIIIEPCQISENVLIENSIVGPYVSIGEGTEIKNSIIKNSIVQKNTCIQNKIMENSMIGEHVFLHGNNEERSIGDYTTEQFA